MANSSSQKWHPGNCLFFIGTLSLAVILVPLEFQHSFRHWSEWVVMLGLFFAVNTGVTAGYHRLFSHRAYQASLPVRGVLLCLGAASFEHSALNWASDHRQHHAFVDQERDPYNIGRGFWHAHWLWLLRNRERRPVGVADLEADPLVRWQHRHHLPLGIAVTFALPVAVGLTTRNLAGHLIMGVLLRGVLTHHATFLINSASHAFGTRPYTDAVSARDNALLAFLACGEGYHNFHHQWQWDYRNGVRWYQWDPTKWLVGALAWAGLASGLRRVPAEVIRKARLLMEEKALLARLAKVPHAAETGLDARVAGARMRLEQTLTALQARREAWQRRKDEQGARLAKTWGQRKAELKAALVQSRREVDLALGEWRTMRSEVRRVERAWQP